MCSSVSPNLLLIPSSVFFFSVIVFFCFHCFFFVFSSSLLKFFLCSSIICLSSLSIFMTIPLKYVSGKLFSSVTLGFFPELLSCSFI